MQKKMLRKMWYNDYSFECNILLQFQLGRSFSSIIKERCFVLCIPLCIAFRACFIWLRFPFEVFFGFSFICLYFSSFENCFRSHTLSSTLKIEKNLAEAQAISNVIQLVLKDIHWPALIHLGLLFVSSRVSLIPNQIKIEEK